MLSALTIAHCVHIMSTQNPNTPWENRKDAVDESLRVNLQPVFMTAYYCNRFSNHAFFRSTSIGN